MRLLAKQCLCLPCDIGAPKTDHNSPLTKTNRQTVKHCHSAVTTFVLRDGQGRCIEVADGKPGLLLIQVTDSAIFEGYTDAEASAKKLVKDVAISGDTYFNSGDLTKTIDVVFSFGK
jgi:hypothetical protein